MTAKVVHFTLTVNVESAFAYLDLFLTATIVLVSRRYLTHNRDENLLGHLYSNRERTTKFKLHNWNFVPYHEISG